MNRITVHIPQMLRDYCRVGPTVSASGVTVAEVLRDLKITHPEVYRSICDETGTMRPHINLFLNSEMINSRQPERLQSAIGPDDTLTVLTAVSGG